jgi:hypothetical protein
MTETQERFLRTVLTRVPLADVVEMHLFPPIRRGTMETGVAVIATVLPLPPLTVVDDTIAPEADLPVEPVAAPAEGTGDADAVAVADVDAVAVADVDVDGDGDGDVDVDGDGDGDVDGDAPAAPVPSPRLRILTAAYRHTIKGIDRGKWTVDVQDEADAPLTAVEAVLRGVRHRSAEPADPELVSLDALAALLEPTRVAPAA